MSLGEFRLCLRLCPPISRNILCLLWDGSGCVNHDLYPAFDWVDWEIGPAGTPYLAARCHGRAHTGVALIHAATMVTAGVFLVACCSPLFQYAANALVVVTVIGAMTCFSLTTGLVEIELKRVIAYSTCSQLGYMIFACGLSQYSVGVFHLITTASSRPCSS